MSYNHQHHKTCNRPVVSHKIVCQHQVEVEVWPAQAEVYFQKEAHIDPVNTQVRFDAIVYNAASNNVLWEVTDIAGNPGAGTIDPTGLYTAPPMGPHGLTDIVVATSIDDPMRKASAMVSLIGFGPAPTPDPIIEIFPKRAYVYYPLNKNSDDFNEYIDASNTKCLLRAYIRNSDYDQVIWEFNGIEKEPSWNKPWFIYKPEKLGDNAEINIEARLKNDPNIKDQMNLFVLNYKWPGMA